MTVRTLTLSPGFDHDVVVDRIDPGCVGAVLQWKTHASGKGLNVSRTIRALGGDTVAYAVVGDSEAAAFTALAERDGYAVSSVVIEQPMRNNLTLRVGDHGATAGHAAGRRFSDVPEQAVRDLFDRLLADISPGDVVSFNGSLPDNSRPTVWAERAGEIHARGALLFADVQGEAMLRLLETRLVVAAKPNHDESRALSEPGEGRQPLDDALAAIRRMHSLGVADPIVTLGAMGALHVDGDLIVRSECPCDASRIEVGAGDAFVAGYCAGVDVVAWQGCRPVALGLATASAHVDGFDGDDLASRVEGRLARIVTEVLEPL
ncbi:1-phosphofructokinase family hexose kinase [Mycobacterium sp. 1274761.0]|uniref:1-phosphofructokinase family hexose kinase n=1 Tax=Mycobacterium sp. 1274761.0 TaxID=1834077 RepID=UPI0007FEA472|nr:PfkB family carbohydrate kinase [Mycobacterium sp. 1274761.0]OBK71303.1 hypothetical protein A5651_19030 [Mycobacterium sp. 1274761.0]